jgi:SPP1 family predicted phage head-tail adaptor
MILESGELDSRLTLYKRSSKRDATGDPIDSPTEIGSYWAKLTVLTNRNAAIGKGFAATVNYEAKLRYRETATNDCEAVINGQRYYVNGVIHDPSRMKNWTTLFLTRLET